MGAIDSPSPVNLPEATGSWIGTNFQFRYPKSLGGGVTGMVVFNGASAGPESTADAQGLGRAIAGKVTTVGADGQILSVNNFTAFHRYGPPPQ